MEPGRRVAWRSRAGGYGVDDEAVGATTSGFVVYEPERERVVFRGGITRGRGLEGDSTGRRELLAQLHRNEPPACDSMVFGCPLFGTNARLGTTGR